MPGLKERAKTLVELADGAAFLFAERPLVVDDKAAALLSADAQRDILRGAHEGAVGCQATGRPPCGGGRDPRICRGWRPEARRRWPSRCAPR